MKKRLKERSPGGAEGDSSEYGDPASKLPTLNWSPTGCVRVSCIALAFVASGILPSDVRAEAPFSLFAAAPLQDPTTGPSALPNERPGPDTDGVVITEELLEGVDNVTGDVEALTEKLEALQARFNELDEEREADAAAKKKKSNYRLTGRVHIDQWQFAESDPGVNFIERGQYDLDPADRFVFRRLRLELAGEVPQNMIFRMQVDFNRPQTPEIKDAYIGWTNLPYNQTLVLGNQKRPLGLDHLNSSRYNVFAERPLAVETFNEDARRFGLTMYGHSDDESLGWAYGLYNLDNIATTGRYIGDAAQFGGYSRLWRSPWYDETSGGRGYWHVALAGALAKPDGDAVENFNVNENEARFRTRPLARSSERWLNTGRIDGAEWYQVLAVENMLNLGSLQITGEYFLTPLQRDDSVAPANQDLFFHGGYIFASYFLTGEHVPYDRTSGTIGRVRPHENFFLVDRFCGGDGHGWGAVQVALRYDYLDLTDGDIRGGVGNMITAGLNWHWTAYSKVQNNLIFGDISESGLMGPATDNGQFVIFGSRFMLDF